MPVASDEIDDLNNQTRTATTSMSQENADKMSNLSLNNAPASQHEAADQFVDSVSAAMPPGMQRKQQMSADEILKEMNRVPLFMTSLDETDGEGGENDMLEAIKALAYEGTKAEVAENFRQQGNEAAREKHWSDAREFYTKAIQTLRGQAKTTEVEDDDPSIKVVEIDEEAETKKERSIEEACLSNRALCNLEMSITSPPAHNPYTPYYTPPISYQTDQGPFPCEQKTSAPATETAPKP